MRNQTAFFLTLGREKIAKIAVWLRETTIIIQTCKENNTLVVRTYEPGYEPFLL